MTIDGISYINPDSINGLNLYAYCGNNPVMRLDPNGTEWWNPTTCDWGAIGRFVGGTALAIAGAAFTIATLPTAISKIGGGVLTQLGFSTMMYGGFMLASVFDSEIKANMDAIGWNPFNTDASIITTRDSLGNIRKVSFYKGVPVIRFNHDFLTSFSFLGIFLNNKKWVNDRVLNHEYGHNMQQMFLGPLKYLLGIAVPSVLFNFASRKNTTLDNLYYSMPWERTAELFGDVISDPYTPYAPYSAEVSLLYFLFLMLI